VRSSMECHCPGTRPANRKQRGNVVHLTLHALANLCQLEKHLRLVRGAEYFATLTAHTACNGFGIRHSNPTISPCFEPVSHVVVVGRTNMTSSRTKWRALDSSTADLEHGVDRKVDATTCPEIVSLFPLMAHINHACPKACNARKSVWATMFIVLATCQELGTLERRALSYEHDTTSHSRTVQDASFPFRLLAVVLDVGRITDDRWRDMCPSNSRMESTGFCQTFPFRPSCRLLAVQQTCDCW
jgi:hypothetical protein